ncbi:MAG: methionyl-tRNA formyltransferase [Chthoniobacterales bacterium]
MPKTQTPRVVFMGTGEIGLPVLKWLAHSKSVRLVGVVTQPDRPVGRSQVFTPPPPKRFLGSTSVPILQPEKVRRPEALAAIRALAPDLIIVTAYGQILPKALLEMPSLACINLHASLLPKYRGAAPIQAAILAGDRHTGITIMYMAEGLDTGDILLTKSIPIRRRETGGSLHDRLGALAPQALEEATNLLLSGHAPRIPQDDAAANYAPKLNRSSGLIDWAQSCWELDRHVRAMNPWPGAYTEIAADDGWIRKLKIHCALPVHRMHGKEAVVIRTSRRGILTGCGNGALLLREIQLEGKRRLFAEEFLHGFRISDGDRLGATS